MSSSHICGDRDGGRQARGGGEIEGKFFKGEKHAGHCRLWRPHHFTRQTNKQINKQTSRRTEGHRHLIKSPLLWRWL